MRIIVDCLERLGLQDAGRLRTELDEIIRITLTEEGNFNVPVLEDNSSDSDASEAPSMSIGVDPRYLPTLGSSRIVDMSWRQIVERGSVEFSIWSNVTVAVYRIGPTNDPIWCTRVHEGDKYRVVCSERKKGVAESIVTRNLPSVRLHGNL